ncbi:TPA: DUF1492 domain-containing protein [Streptococcus suis]
MRAKQYLMQVWHIDRDIQSRIEERENILKTQISGIDYSKDSVQEGQKVFDDRYMKYLQLRDEIDAKIDELIDLKREISRQIDCLDDKVSMIVLRERYINMKSWSQIASSFGTSERHVWRMHKIALIQFEKMSENVSECH